MRHFCITIKHKWVGVYLYSTGCQYGSDFKYKKIVSNKNTQPDRQLRALFTDMLILYIRTYAYQN